MTDFGRTPEQQKILKLIFGRQVMGRPFAGPPGMPKDRIDILRKAFTETVADKDFLADAARMKLEVKAVSGARIEHLVDEIYATTTPQIARRASEMIK